MPLSAYAFDRAHGGNALVLGFAAVPPAELYRGMQGLAAAIEAARGSWTGAGIGEGLEPQIAML